MTDECPVCLESFEEDDKKRKMPRSFPCPAHHSVCSDCVGKLMHKGQFRCPVCAADCATFTTLPPPDLGITRMIGAAVMINAARATRDRKSVIAVVAMIILMFAIGAIFFSYMEVTRVNQELLTAEEDVRKVLEEKNKAEEATQRVCQEKIRAEEKLNEEMRKFQREKTRADEETKKSRQEKTKAEGDNFKWFFGGGTFAGFATYTLVKLLTPHPCDVLLNPIFSAACKLLTP